MLLRDFRGSDCALPTVLNAPPGISNNFSIPHPLHEAVFDSLFDPLQIRGVRVFSLDGVCFEAMGYPLSVDHVSEILNKFLARVGGLRPRDEMAVNYVQRAQERFEKFVKQGQHALWDPAVTDEQHREITVEHSWLGRCAVLPIVARGDCWGLETALGVEYKDCIKGGTSRPSGVGRPIAQIALPLNQPVIAGRLLQRLFDAGWWVAGEYLTPQVAAFIQSQGRGDRIDCPKKPSYDYEPVLYAEGKEVTPTDRHRVARHAFSWFIYQDLGYKPPFGWGFMQAFDQSSCISMDRMEGGAFIFDLKAYVDCVPLRVRDFEWVPPYNFDDFMKNLRTFLSQCRSFRLRES